MKTFFSEDCMKVFACENDEKWQIITRRICPGDKNTQKGFHNDVIGVLQRTLTSLAPSLHLEFRMSILKVNVKRALVMSMFIEVAPLLACDSDRVLRGIKTHFRGL